MAHSTASNARSKELFRIPSFDDGHSESNIYVTNVKGPFDLQAINALAKMRFRYLSELNNTTVATIVVFQNNLFITPEALERFACLLREQLTQLQKTFIVAFVAPANLAGRARFCKTHQEIYSKLNVAWKDFEEIDNARIWINGLMDGRMNDSE